MAQLPYFEWITRKFANGLDRVNFTITPFGRMQLWQYHELQETPDFIKQGIRNIRAAQWTHRIPIIQRKTPIHLAALRILKLTDNIHADDQQSTWIAVEMLSGANSPIHQLESMVNAIRIRHGKRPIQFLLTDIHPQIDAWERSSAPANHLSYVPTPVDPSDPTLTIHWESTATEDLLRQHG
jgi:hypothetical protein